MEKTKVETVNEHCKHEDCLYRQRLGNHGGTIEYCDYLCMTGKSRGCEISKCDKYIKGKRTRKGINMAGGVTYELVFEEEYGQDGFDI